MWRSLAFLCILTPIVAFLIDGSTSKPLNGGTFIIDGHYNALMDLFIQERQSRRNLEQFVVQLSQRITIIEKDNVHMKAKIVTLEKGSLAGEDHYEALQNETKAVRQNYVSLLREHADIKRDFSLISLKADNLETEMLGLKQLKTIVQLQNVEAIENMTVHLEKEIQKTNTNVNLLFSDGNARKQDFLALVNVTAATKSDLSNVQSLLNKKLNNITNFTFSSLNALKRNIDSKIQNLTATSNKTIAKLSESTEKACARSQMVNSGDIIKFSSLINSYGIQNIDSFKQTGIFTCERKGLYVVFASMMSKSRDATFRIYKNASPSNVIYVSYQSERTYESGSGMASFELNVGDKVSVRANRDNIVVDSYSCYSLFKVK